MEVSFFISDLSANIEISPPQFALGLAAIVTVPAIPTEPMWGEVYGKFDDDPEAEAFYLGSAVAGGTVYASGLALGNRPFRVFLRSKTDKQIEGVTDLRNAEQTVFYPNLETLTPIIHESAPATNTQVFIYVSNYTPASQFREIQWSLVSGFTSPTTITQDTTNEANHQLDPSVSIMRSTNLTNAETRYIRVRHSSNGDSWTAWSNTLMVTFANSGGTGGTGGGTPPPTGGGGSASCFSGETILYLFNETTVLEETRFTDVYRRKQVGRTTISFNMSGEQVEGEIAKLFKTSAREWFYVEFSDGEWFEVTAGHKFFTGSEYVAIRDLPVGATVQNADGTFSVLTKKEPRKGLKEFFNMHIAEHMNYCVGKTRKRVHNLKVIEE